MFHKYVKQNNLYGGGSSVSRKAWVNLKTQAF